MRGFPDVRSRLRAALGGGIAGSLPIRCPNTIHRAKGAEVKLVVLLAGEEQLLLSWGSLASPDPRRLEEERRLFYVAATRAKDRLLITHTAESGRRPTGGPSRFIAEAHGSERRNWRAAA